MCAKVDNQVRSKQFAVNHAKFVMLSEAKHPNDK